MRWRARLPSDGVLFLLAVVVEATIVGTLLAERRIPSVHDGHLYLALQYAFLNGAATAGEVPHWMPFLTQGVVGTWLWALQASLLQNVLLLAGPLVRSANFLPLYYLGLLVDELVLLAGVWLLGGRFFASPAARFVVAMAVLGSSLWSLQPWFNFHFVYAVPLVLHFVHLFFERGQWRYAVLAGNLLALQVLGNLPYLLPMTTFLVVVYVAAYVVLHPDGFRQARGVRWNVWSLPSLGVIALGFAVVWHALHAGTGDLVLFAPGREGDGRASLDVFLTYGANTGWRRWVEVLLRVSPALDYTLYIGIPTLALAIVGAGSALTRRTAHLAVTATAALAIAMATPLAAALYHAWPLMAFYRHVAGVGGFVRLFLCFLAGLGIDALMRRGSAPAWRVSASAWSGAVSMLALTGGLVWLVRRGDLLDRVSLIATGAVVYGPALGEDAVRRALVEAGVLAATTAILLALATAPRAASVAAGLLVVVATVDVVTYKATQSRLLMRPLTAEARGELAFQPIPYHVRRCAAAPCGRSPRAAHLRADTIGAQYHTTAALLFEDVAGVYPRAEYWQRPIDDIMRAYAGQPIGDTRTRPSGLVYYQALRFPLEHPGAAVLAGVTEDKIRFFARARRVDDAELVARFITSRGYRGDELFVTLPSAAGPGQDGGTTTEGLTSAGERLHLPYRVERFDANHLVISVDAGPRTSAWLAYSDAWHPFWRATVNDAVRPVYRANLAYKAVPLAPGVNRVHLAFEVPGLRLLQVVFGLDALAWLGILAWAMTRIVVRGVRD